MAKGKRTMSRRRPARSWGWRVRRLLGYVTLLVLLSVAAGLVFLAGVFHRVTQDLPSLDRLTTYQGGATEIYATDKGPDGKNIVLGRIFIENRESVPIKRIPQVLKDATVAIEDERFFHHPGVDLRGIARALYVNFVGGRLLEGQGGSTLTQQLARDVYLTKKKDVRRKAQEIMLAIQIEKNYSKEEILERYLNQIYYGSGAYGVQAASKVYFGKPVKDLSLAQAALLAGLPQRPAYSPYENKEAAIARRNVVLAKMAQLGYITAQEAEAAQKNGVRLIGEKPRNEFEFKAPYFVNYVVRQLVDRYGYEKVSKGGLKVYTTLNWKMQQEAERALREGVKGAARQGVTQGALVCVEPRTGYIRAMVGGVDHKQNQFNNAVQGRRQPGSAFKVVVYSAAFDTRRFDPDSRVSDSPVSFPAGGGKWYTPQNYGGGYHGRVSIRQALTHSYNIPAVKVAHSVGVRRVIEYARRMGVTSPLDPYLPLALGASGVSPLEMAAVYSVFPNGGNRVVPMGIIRVLNHEKEILEENAPQVERAVLRNTTVAQMSEILGNVVARGTAAGAQGIHEVPRAHGKTGTTNDNRDAWFIGYTPELCTAVWVSGARYFKKNGTMTAKYPTMSGVTGGRVCAPIWARFMKPGVAIQRKAGEPAPPAEVAAPQTASAPPRPLAAGGAERDGWGAVPEPEPVDLTPAAPARRRAARAGADSNLPPAPAEEAHEPPTPAPAAPAQPAAPAGPGGLPLALAPTPVAAEYPVAQGTTVAPRPAREVTATVCVDSGRQATRWCPETVARTLLASRAPRGHCRVHRPRPGDG